MKAYRYFLPIVLITATLFYGQLSEPAFNIVVNIILVFLFVLFLLLWEYAVVNYDFDAQLKFRKKTKTPQPMVLFFAVFFSIQLWSYELFDSLTLIVSLIWIVLVKEIILIYVYRVKKPVGIFISGNEFIQNNTSIEKRDLRNLQQIQYDRISKSLKLDFIKKRELSVNTLEYSREDIEQLLEILIERSEHSVFIPDNYHPVKK